MKYLPNPMLFSSVFVMPSAVADEHIKLASAAALKVILCLFRCQNEVFDLQNIANKTGLSAGEVADACAYWADKGVLLCDCKEVAEPEAKQEVIPAEKAPSAPKSEVSANLPAQVEKTEVKKKTREKLTVSPSRPTHAQICKRLDECAEIRELFNEAQTVLGRMLGTGDQAALLLLFDYYGLPADVLLMLCEYARTMGKAGNLNYIYAVGQDWSEREIDTFERADEELRRLAEVDTNWSQFCALTGMQHLKPTKGQQKYMHTWISEWKFTVPMLAVAFEKMKEHTDGVRFSYMNGILKNWLSKGIMSPEQVEKEEQEFKEKAQESIPTRPTKNTEPKAEIPAGVSSAVAKSGIAAGPASYDLDKAEQAARNTVPTLKKRKKN
ncbi:MAG: DnaD domain protein [Clostridia bacterium]|nr:DnaD domain protein [Clostridia bacterium]